MTTATRRRLSKTVRSARWIEAPVAEKPGTLEVVVGRESVHFTVTPSQVSEGAAFQLDLDGDVDGFVLPCDGRQRCFCSRWHRSQRCEHVEGLALAAAR
jgi:hypothetical protein